MRRLTNSGLRLVLIGTMLVPQISSQGARQGKPRGTPPGKIAWGKPVEGLQAGIRLVSGGRTWHIGDTVQFAFVVRNVTDHAIDVTYYPVQERFGWTAMTTAMRNSKSVMLLPARPPREDRDLPLGPAVGLRIEPGKELPVPGGTPRFIVAESGNSSFARTPILLVPGDKVTVQAQPLVPVAKGEEWLTRLVTGMLEFAVERTWPGGASSSP